MSLSDASYKGQSSDWVVLWSAKLNKTSHTISQLRFDPTEQTHTYKLVINEDTSMFDEVSAIFGNLIPTVILQFVCYATFFFLVWLFPFTNCKYYSLFSLHHIHPLSAPMVVVLCVTSVLLSLSDTVVVVL